MKVSKFKLAFTVLLTATIVWSAWFIFSLPAYQNYVRDLYESTPLVLRPYIDVEPYWMWRGSLPGLFAGVVVVCVWLSLVAYKIQYIWKGRKGVKIL